MTDEVKLLPCGVENFLSAIMAKTPNGEWITVQYHPNGDWSVAAEVASTNDDLAWLKGEVEHCRCMEYVTEAERYERIYNALLATRPTIVTDEVVALSWLAEHKNAQVYWYGHIYGDDAPAPEEWRVDLENGSINDREWTTVGRGETPLAAIIAAMPAIVGGE